MTGDEHRAAAEAALREAEKHAGSGRLQSTFVWIELARMHVLLADREPPPFLVPAEPWPDQRLTPPEWDAAHSAERPYVDGSPE